MKKVGILGSGEVARSLGSGFLRHGYDVMLGSREPAKLTEWQESTGAKGRTGSFEQAAKFGEMVVLAVKGVVAAEAIKLAGLSNLTGKVVIDATNPIADLSTQNGVLRFFTNLDESLMERLQKQFPGVRFVKAFNSVGSAHMVDPRFHGGRPTMFICGNDESARKDVGTILNRFGWDVADMGKVEAARAIEPLCMLWCIPGLLHNEWSHAFKLLR